MEGRFSRHEPGFIILEIKSDELFEPVSEYNWLLIGGKNRND